MLITSVVLAATKVRLPLVPSGATVSLSYCTNFAALALFSPFEATFIIAVSVWSQCVLNNTGRNAVYRTVFSIANIVVAAAVANATAGLVGGLSVGQDGTALVVPTLAGASAFFFCNTLMLAVAVALQSGKSPSTLWMEQFLWSAPACFVGAILGMCAAYLIDDREHLRGVRGHPDGALLLGLPHLPRLHRTPAGHAHGDRRGARAGHRRARPDARSDEDGVGQRTCGESSGWQSRWRVERA